MRITVSRVLTGCTVILINFCVLWSLKCPEGSDQKIHPRHHDISSGHPKSPIKSVSKRKDGHRLAIIVPFRDRFDELLEFAPAIDDFLNKSGIDHEIFVINQSDNLRFNRASLINVGFVHTQDLGFDYLAMHDVDLIPMTHQIKYDYPELGPVHLASPGLHPLYHYPNYVGGILLLTHEHFNKCNGMANKFWGWGREDDDFFLRMKDAKLTVTRPKNVTTGYNTYRHVHDKQRRKRDFKRIGEQKKDQFLRDKEGTFANTQYDITRTDKLVIGDTKVTVLHTVLKCDQQKTPWCQDQTE